MLPLLLSIETASPICSVALHRGEELIATIEHHVARAHGEALQAMVDTLCQVSKVTVSDLEAVAISKGPGSYTGLRIGTALAKGICYGRNIPLLAVNTLATLIAASHGYPLPSDTIRCGLLDARRGYAYALLMNSQGDLLQPTHTCEVTQEAFHPWLTQGNLCFMGSGVDHYADKLAPIANSLHLRGLYPQAKHLGRLAYQQLLAGDLADCNTFSPLYLSALAASQKTLPTLPIAASSKVAATKPQ